MGYHAKLAPSSADRWTSCTASIREQEGKPNRSTAAARQGTVCHQMSEEILVHGLKAQSYLGRVMVFWSDIDGNTGEAWRLFNQDPVSADFTIQFEETVTQPMVDAVIIGTSYVLDVCEQFGGKLTAEQPVPIGHFTGEEGATGTCDVEIIYGDRVGSFIVDGTLHIMDFKYGRHKVLAYDLVYDPLLDLFSPGEEAPRADPNKQLACYALGAIEKYRGRHTFKRVHFTIVQPMLEHISEYDCSVDELMLVQQLLLTKANETRTNPVYVPSAENCYFCRASGYCGAQRDFALEAMRIPSIMSGSPISEITREQLGDYYDKLELVRNWCTAIEDRVERELKLGHSVGRSDGRHYKLVAGKSGRREWRDVQALETYLKETVRLRDTDMYEMVLISPTRVEAMTKLNKEMREKGFLPMIGQTQWARMKEFIRQSSGADHPVVALSTDPRPAIGNKASGFEEVADVDPNGDLF